MEEKKRDKKKDHQSLPTTSSCTHAALTERAWWGTFNVVAEGYVWRWDDKTLATHSQVPTSFFNNIYIDQKTKSPNTNLFIK